jgi:uncharacterized protein YjbI with pentapeptide repeats
LEKQIKSQTLARNTNECLREIVMANGAQESNGKRIVPISEIIDKMQKGKPIEYDGVVVRGNLDVTKLDLRKENDMFLVNSPIKITDSKIEGNINFNNTIFIGEINYHSTEFEAGIARKGDRSGVALEIEILNINFEGAVFRETVIFSDAIFRPNVNFKNVIFCKEAIFLGTAFWQNADFSQVAFDKDAAFMDVKFRMNTVFSKATFSDDAIFMGAIFSQDADFVGVIFGKEAFFEIDGFKGKYLNFNKAKFKNAENQEYLCRLAKKMLEDTGNRDESDNNFYLEMDAKRRKKTRLLRIFDLIVFKSIFGYGVHPLRLMLWWIIMVIFFAVIYWGLSGIQSRFLVSALPSFFSSSDYINLATYKNMAYFFESLYFSVITAATPGYGKYELTSWLFQIPATFEAIFGTFMWAAFITTFARKFLR